MATTPGRQISDVAAAFATAALSQNETAYFAALGRMIAAYARAEAGVQFLARYLSGLSDTGPGRLWRYAPIRSNRAYSTDDAYRQKTKRHFRGCRRLPGAA